MFPTRERSIERANLRNTIRLLVVFSLLISGQVGKTAYSKNYSLFEFDDTNYQKETLNNSEEMENTLLRISVGIYIIQDDRFKEIYAGQDFTYGFGLAKKVYSSKQHNFFLSLDFKFYSKTGKSTVTEQETKLILKPITLGGIYLFAKKRIFPFAEVGLDYYPYKEESVLHSTSGSAWGFHLQGGILIPLKIVKSLKGKFYLRYSIINTEENNLEVNLGGIEYGLGLVYGFDLF